MLGEVGAPLFEHLEVLLEVDFGQRLAGSDFRSSAVHLERSDRRDEDHCVRVEAGDAALDVAELFHSVRPNERIQRCDVTVAEADAPDVGAEASLGHDVAVLVLRLALLDARQLERNLVRQDRRVAMGDVGERSGVDEDRGAFEGLHEVGLDGVFHQDGHGAGAANVIRRDGLALLAVGHDHPPEPAYFPLASWQKLVYRTRGRTSPSCRPGRC